MGYIILAIIFIVLGLSLPGFISKEGYGWLRRTIPTLFAIIAFFFIFATSFVIIDADKVGHLKRIYLDKKMPPGQIIAWRARPGRARHEQPAEEDGGQYESSLPVHVTFLLLQNDEYLDEALTRVQRLQGLANDRARSVYPDPGHIHRLGLHRIPGPR